VQWTYDPQGVLQVRDVTFAWRQHRISGQRALWLTALVLVTSLRPQRSR
jgi:hypothetical protein